MRSPLARHIAASALTLVLLGTVTGCAALPGASSPVPTSTSSPSPAPTTPVPEGTPTTAPQPSQPSVPAFGAFTKEQLAQVCIDATVSAFAPDVSFDVANTRIEHRMVSPEWLVLVPATSSGYAAQAQCTIGGAPAAPELGMSSASIQRLPEEQIQNLIRGDNEGGD